LEEFQLEQGSLLGELLAPKLNRLYIMTRGHIQWTGFLKYNPHALNWFCLYSIGTPMPALEALLFLTQHPNMESYEIHLNDFDGDEDENELPLVKHPSLTSLTIHYTFQGANCLERLLPYLQAPKLKLLKIYPEDDHEVRNDLPTISNFVIASNMALRSLVLCLNRYVAVDVIPPSAFENLMCSLPSLEKLRIDSGDLGTHFLSVLNRTLHPDILPSLVSLRLYDCSMVPSDILAVLKSRTTPCHLSLLEDLKGVRLSWREYGQSMRIPLREIDDFPQKYDGITIQLINCFYEDEEEDEYYYHVLDDYDSDDDFFQSL